MSKPEVVAWMVAGLREATMHEVSVMDWDDEGENVESLIRLTDHEAARAADKARIAGLEGLLPEFPPRPPEGSGMPRYGLRWNGPSQPLAVPMDDGYWTPWHLAEAERNELLGLLRELIDIEHIREVTAGPLRDIVRRADAALDKHGEQP